MDAKATGDKLARFFEGLPDPRGPNLMHDLRAMVFPTFRGRGAGG